MSTSFTSEYSKNSLPDSSGQQPQASVARSRTRGHWWFRLTAPHEPENATFAQREAARRGRLASMTIVFISFYAMLPLPNALLQGNMGFLFVLVITELLNGFALFVLNRNGRLRAAGWLVVSILDAGFALAFLAMPEGVSLLLLPAFDLMVAALMVVVAFFPPRSVFVLMTINILFIVLWLVFGRHTHDITVLLATTPYTILFPSVALELFLAVLIFFWVSSATNAIANLDRSQEIVALERREIEQQEQQLKLKQQLEDGVEKILQTHVRAANGDFSARAPLTRENVLWQIAYSLNNLLARLQHNAELQGQMARTEDATRMLAAYVRSARENKVPLQPLQRTGTVVDEVIVELMIAANPSPHQPATTRLYPYTERTAQRSIP